MTAIALTAITLACGLWLEFLRERIGYWPAAGAVFSLVLLGATFQALVAR